MMQHATFRQIVLLKVVRALGAVAILQMVAKYLRGKKAIQGAKKHGTSQGAISCRARIGQVLGDFLPHTKKSREVLFNFHWKDPSFINTEIVETTAGKLRGFRQEEAGPLIFRGVPFATARRLERPVPVEPWKGERSCLRFGPACPQPAFGGRLGLEGMGAAIFELLFPPLPADQSYWYGNMVEDECLNANVCTPNLEGKRPVLVFIHGGAFAYGSNIEGGAYESSQLTSTQDIVVVNINYRLGPFGFLHFPEHGITNLGIRDQIAGLEWVRDNIGKFGGDPSNVTISGESAGGMSVGTLISSPLARGLFHRAVAMSGATLNAHSEQPWQHTFQEMEAELAHETGGPLTPETFKKIPAHKLVSFVTKTQVNVLSKQKLGSFALQWQPYRDGDVVPKDGSHSNLAGAVPILTGCTNNEWKYFERYEPVLKSKEEVMKMTVEFFRQYFHRTTKDDKFGDVDKWNKHAASLYDLIVSCRGERGLPVELPDMRAAIWNFFLFEEPNFCLARDAGAFAYNLHFREDGHAVDLALLFGFRGMAAQEINQDLTPVTQEDRARSRQFQDLIGDFARCGALSVNGLGWKPQSEIMDLAADPQVRQFKKELVEFQHLKRAVVADLGIDTILPQIVAA